MVMKFLLLLLFGNLVALGRTSTLKFQPDVLSAYATVGQDGQLELRYGSSSGSEIIAEVRIGLGTNKTGWSYMHGWTNGSFDDIHQAYTVGYLETEIDPLINLHIRNTMGGRCTAPNTPFCKRLHQYLSTNIKFMKTQILQNRKKDPFWHQVELMLWQIQGMDDSHKKKAMLRSSAIISDNLNIDPFGVFLLQMASGDLAKLTDALTPPSQRRNDTERLLESGHCSGLIKRTPKNGHLFVSQDTWTEYSSMLRYLKLYEFNFRETAAASSAFIAGATQSFSSYPGVMMSGDDFYVMESNLVTLETTNGIYNQTLFDIIRNSAGSVVFEFLRSQAANRLARNISEWQRIFATRNSGTYNNQWMVVDYNKVKTGEALPSSGVLGVSEQIPGLVVSKDKSAQLLNTTYWPSYNTPAFSEIYDLSEFGKMAKKYGNFFTYDANPRARIFHRDHHKVVDEASMIRLMRYNDFKHDPLARCKCRPPYSGENGIAARNDLSSPNGSYPFSALGYRNHGATDMKLATSWLLNNVGFIAVSSPTYDQQPPFRWSTSGLKAPHYGHPDLWAFKPIFTPWRRIRQSRTQQSFFLDPKNIIIFPY